MNPRVSVLMPVYNGEKYVRGAIESILSQTYGDFELLAIDDGSKDGTAAILKSMSDPRLRVITQSRNIGLIAVLNSGIQAARGEYIARMDADDISLPTRLEVQVAFADSHPEVGICGSALQRFGNGREVVISPLREHDDIVCALLFGSQLYHPTVIMRKGVLVRHGLKYEESLYAAEDYGLWVEASKWCRLANVPEVLLRYRLHETQVGSLKAKEQLATANRIRRRQLMALNPDLNDADLEVHNWIASRNIPEIKAHGAQAMGWLQKLRRLNQSAQKYAEPAFSQCMAKRERWVRNHLRSPFQRKVRRLAGRIASFVSRQ
jgi:glycosyltransferase involved in cell wall biosynthesis